MADIVSTLNTIKTRLGIDSVYSHWTEPTTPPYIAYIGAGQNQFRADDTTHWRQNAYQVEYYFAKKDESKESSIEDIFLADGWIYSKSDDAYEESLGLFVIFYDLN